MNPLISIIVPVYNTERYLNNCIESILNQSYNNIELILVNDGSTDGSELICLDFSHNDKRVKYLYKTNGGPSSARNIGLDYASGEYISFIDSDDFVDNYFIENLLFGITSAECEVAVCGRKIISHRAEKDMFVLNGNVKWSSKQALRNLLTWNNIDGSCCDKLFHHLLFKGRRFPDDCLAEDLPVLTTILLEVDFIVHVGKPLYFYCKREGSRTCSAFSKSKMSIISSSGDVSKVIKSKYPDLSREADSYYFFHLLLLRTMIVGHEKKYPNEYMLINALVSQNFYKIMCNPYIPPRHKLSLTLQRSGMYSFIKNLIKFSFR